MKRLFVLICSISVLLPLNAHCHDKEPKKVLVLHAYHQGLEWADSITRGIQDAFSGMDNRFSVHFDYLDTKRNTSSEYYAELTKLYAKKNTLIQYEAIIIADNNALTFFIENQSVFKNSPPAIFCGINNFDPTVLNQYPQLTGIEEKTDFDGTLELMLRLHPNTQKIVIVNDQTATGQAIKSQLQQILPRFKHRVKFDFLSEFNITTIEEDLSLLGENDLIYLLTVNQDSKGQFISYKHGVILLRNSTDVPIYGSWDFYLGKGIVGGNIVSGYEQGKAAGEIALRILNGTNASEIPVIRTPQKNYQFDYNELKRLNLDQKKLPANSTIINRPPTYTKACLLFGITFVTLLALGFTKHLHAKKLNQRLEREKTALDKIVGERTARLNEANAKLTQEIEERKRIENALRESNQTKDKLFSIIAHDLKNPFWGLINLTEILSKEWHSFSQTEIDETLQELHNQSKSTYELLQSLLTWSSIKQNRIEHAPQQVELFAVVENCIQLITSNAKRKKIKIENRINGNISEMLDEFVLTTVMNNLLGNAVKFSPHGKQILIEAEQYPQKILISVSDSGAGIASEKLETLFSIQTDDSTLGTDNETGTGLGLPICQELLEKIGGTIWAENKEGDGSIFHFTLPITNKNKPPKT